MIHVPALDGLRGVAILLVLLHMFQTPQPPGADPGLILRGLDDVMRSGWVGVQLFFVLSGYLITGGLLDTKTAPHHFLNFYARRALRIFPLYYAVLLAAFVLRPLFITKPFALNDAAHDQVWLWTYLYNWVHYSGHEVLGFSHFWSLAVEEQFYLLWPLVIFRLRPSGVLRLCGLVICAAIIFRIGLRMEGVRPGAIYMFTFSRMDALAAGGAVAALLRLNPASRPAPSRRPIILTGALCLIACSALLPWYNGNSAVMQSLGMTGLAIGFAAIVLKVSGADPDRGTLSTVLSVAPLRLLGKYSYGMYVFHLPLNIFVYSKVLEQLPGGPSGLRPLIYFALASSCTFVLAALSYHLYERPIMQLKYHLPRNWAVATP